MKLPFDFGIKLIFRLVIPGFFLCLGLIPLLNITLDLIGWTNKFEYAFVVLVIFAGWVITICDMRIYMLFEGRRYWPARVQTFFRKREQARLAKLIERTKSSDELVSKEAYFDLRNFPMNEADDYVAPYPFRLGNLLTAFEQYSSRTYGIDSIFYWPRIWLKIDKDTREEIDSSQALADSTVYTSFAFYFSGLVWLSFAVLRLIGHLVVRESPSLTAQLSSWVVTIDRLLPHKLAASLASIGFVSAGFLIYRLSLYLHAQFGEYFKSLFDSYASEIDVSEVINELSIMSSESPVVCLSKTLTRQDQFKIAARYLQYQRYRCPNPTCNALLTPTEIEKHVCPDFHLFLNATVEDRRRSAARVVAVARVVPEQLPAASNTEEVQMAEDEETVTPTQSAKYDQLRPLGDYIRQLYLVGGVPLVVLGIGAANLFLPYSFGNPGAKLAVTILLFAIGGLTWGTSMYVTLHRWKTETETLARQDEILLTSICEIARNEDRSENVERRITGLMRNVNNLGVRWARGAIDSKQLPNGES